MIYKKCIPSCLSLLEVSCYGQEEMSKEPNNDNGAKSWGNNSKSYLLADLCLAQCRLGRAPVLFSLFVRLLACLLFLGGRGRGREGQ